MYHGWMVIQFRSGYAHYLSLSKRCLESNLQINRRLTKEILEALEDALINSSPAIIPEIVGEDEALEKLAPITREIDEDGDWDFHFAACFDWEIPLPPLSTPLPLPIYSSGTVATKKEILATVEKGKGYSRLRKGELIEGVNSGRIGLK
jgi:hypothetical protein